MKKTYETPALELIRFQPLETVTASVAAQAMHGFFDDDNIRRQTSE